MWGASLLWNWNEVLHLGHTASSNCKTLVVLMEGIMDRSSNSTIFFTAQCPNAPQLMKCKTYQNNDIKRMSNSSFACALGADHTGCATPFLTDLY
jgi:hypothetical protein